LELAPVSWACVCDALKNNVVMAIHSHGSLRGIDCGGRINQKSTIIFFLVWRDAPAAFRARSCVSDALKQCVENATVRETLKKRTCTLHRLVNLPD